jgi:hypothetical protein
MKNELRSKGTGQVRSYVTQNLSHKCHILSMSKPLYYVAFPRKFKFFDDLITLDSCIYVYIILPVEYSLLFIKIIIH